eukprot:jgi/Hompol1/1356/HPOL_004520-RA
MEAKKAQPKPSTRLWVGNFPPQVTEYTLVKLFQSAGKLVNIDYLWHRDGPREGEPRGYCFIEMESIQDARRAVAMLDNSVVAGRPLAVRYSTAREPSAASDDLAPWQRRQARESAAAAAALVNPNLQADKATMSTSDRIKAIERRLASMQRTDKDAAETQSGDSFARLVSNSSSRRDQNGTSRSISSSNHNRPRTEGRQISGTRSAPSVPTTKRFEPYRKR